MKKNLLLALSFSLLMVVGCKKNTDSVTPDDAPLMPSDAAISLNADGPGTRVGNQGVRVKNFQDGDQIGVIATRVEADGLTSAWSKEVYFDNTPSFFTKVDDSKPLNSLFGWGLNSTSSVSYTRYYPTKAAKIIMYAYYPYADGVAYVKPDAATQSKPKVQVTLNTEKVVLADKTGANVKQADVLYSVPTSPVSTEATLSTPLAFRHALSQLTFRFAFSKNETSTSKFFIDTIKFSTVQTATMDVTTGKFDYGTTVKPKDAKYVIVPSVRPALKQAKEDPATDKTMFFDVFKPETDVTFTPLMLFPLDLVTARLSSLDIVVTTGEGAEAKQQSYSVSLKALNNTPFEVGKKSTFDIVMTKQTEITLAATIEAWSDGPISDLEVGN